MHYRKLLFIALFCLALCASAQAQPPMNPETDFMWGPFKCGETFDMEKAEAAMGKDKTVTSYIVRQTEEGSVWSSADDNEKPEEGEIFGYEADFPGVRFSVAGDKLQSIAVTGNRYGTARGLQVGDDLEKVVELYGAPAAGYRQKTSDGEGNFLMMLTEKQSDGTMDALYIHIDGKEKVKFLFFGNTLRPVTEAMEREINEMKTPMSQPEK